MVDYCMWCFWFEEKRKKLLSRTITELRFISHMLYIIMYVQSHTVIVVFNVFFFSGCNMTSALVFVYLKNMETEGES